jgi:hypothetical protein
VLVKEHVVAAHDSASAADPVDPVYPGILSKSSRRAMKSGNSSAEHVQENARSAKIHLDQIIIVSNFLSNSLFER